MKNNDAIALFLKREWQVLVGRRYGTVALFVLTFFVAVGSVGFGSASLEYLRHKMNDAFINWVDIIANQTTGEGKTPINDFLVEQDNRKRYSYDEPEGDKVSNLTLWKKNGQEKISVARAIKPGSRVMDKILSPENVVLKRNGRLSENDLGVVITLDELTRLGYSKDSLPLFVYCKQGVDTATARKVSLPSRDFRIALPIAAVVRQLPLMNALNISTRLRNAFNSGKPEALDITYPSNINDLTVCIEQSEVQAFQQLAQEKGWTNYEVKPYLEAYRPLKMVTMNDVSDDAERVRVYNERFAEIRSRIKEAERIYSFNPDYGAKDPTPDHISVYMTSLDSIRAFQEAVQEKCGIKIEMSSIDAKENFRFVESMGGTLSWCVIAIVVLFVCVFIYFLLSSHFAKIQRNLGTFKAFGISNRTLFFVYCSLVLGIVCLSYVVAMALVAFFSGVLGLFTEVEPGFPWVTPFAWQNFALLAVVVVAAALVTYVVSKRTFSHTPGDIIYNRGME